MQNERHEELGKIIDNQRYFNLLQIDDANVPYLRAWLNGTTDNDPKLLLRVLLLKALERQRNQSEKETKTLQVLIEVNSKYAFVEKNDAELLNAAIRTKKPWVVWQILSLGIDPKLVENDNREDLSKYLNVSRDVKIQRLAEICAYTEGGCVERINKEVLNDLWRFSRFNSNAIDFWLSGIDKTSVKEFLESLLENAKITGDLKTHIYFLEMRLFKKSELTKEEYDAFIRTRESAVEQFITNSAQFEVLLTHPDYALLYSSWFFGLDYEGIHSGDPNYTCINLLNDLLEAAVKNSDDVFFNILMEINQNQKFIDNTRTKTMHLALGKLNFVQPLLDCGFDPNGPATDPYLFRAFLAKHSEVVKALLDKGADPYLKNTHYANKTFMTYAKKRLKYQPNFKELLAEYEKTHPAPAPEPKVLEKKVKVDIKGPFSKVSMLIFTFDNPAAKYNNLSINKWFNNKLNVQHFQGDGFDNFHVYFKWKDEGSMTLIEAINILARKGLTLTDESVKTLKDAYDKGKEGGASESYLGLYEGFDDYAKKRGVEMEAPQKNKESEKDEKSSSHEFEEKAKVMDSAFSWKSGKWTALGFKPEVSKNNYKKYFASLNLNSTHLQTHELPENVQHSLHNLCLYGGKLLSELASLVVGDKKKALWSKEDALRQFIKKVLSQKELTEDSIRDAYDELEREDVNRGTGLYRIHTFFKWKTFDDENGNRRFVKSTVGELAYDLMQAVKNQPEVIADDEQNQSEENPSTTVG